MNAELIQLIIEAVVGVAVVIISGHVIPWLKEKLGSEKMCNLEAFIEAAVRAAEQIYTPEQWKDKKEYVLRLASERLQEMGLELSEDVLNAIIEGIVNSVKHG